MTLSEIRSSVIAPALLLLPARMSSRQAELMLLVIQLQEDPQQRRRQVGGPARGLWQFEERGGTAGVLAHVSSRAHAQVVCEALGITPTAATVYWKLQSEDVLAAAFARLLLWTDPAALPAVGEVEQAWQLYLRTWRPGAAKRDYAGLRKKWSVNYSHALELLV
jgi:hypothetical protein